MKSMGLKPYAPSLKRIILVLAPLLRQSTLPWPRPQRTGLLSTGPPAQVPNIAVCPLQTSHTCNHMPIRTIYVCISANYICNLWTIARLLIPSPKAKNNIL